MEPRAVFFRGSFGSVFKIDSASGLTTLHRFSGNDGYNPGPLTQVSDGSFYGTTEGGPPIGLPLKATAFRHRSDRRADDSPHVQRAGR